MGRKLYGYYTELSNDFARKHHLDLKDNSIVHVSKSLTVIRAEINRIHYMSFLEAQGELVEMAAYLGELLRSELGGEWEQVGRERMIYINGMNTYLIGRWFSPLRCIVEAWKKPESSFLEEECRIILDGKKPLTEAQMLDQQKRILDLRARGDLYI
jgi:hypothetical protein